MSIVVVRTEEGEVGSVRSGVEGSGPREEEGRTVAVGRLETGEEGMILE